MTTLSHLTGREHARFLDSVRQASVITEPFPHAIIDGALSADFLAQAYQNLPEKSLFNDAGHGLLAFQIWDKSEDLTQWRSPRKAFWQQCNEQLFDDAIAGAIHALFTPARQALYQRLFGDTADKKQDMIQLQPWATCGALNIRAAGSSLPTHMDWPNRLYSLIVYLDPDETASPDWGTRLFHGPQIIGSEGVDIMAKRAPDHVKSCTPEAATLIPFKPGRIAIFMNTPWSYHGAQVQGADGASRFCLVKGINMTLDSTEQLFGLPPELK